MTYYHIVYDLETQYKTLHNALRANEAGTWLLPEVPLQTMPDEDSATKRICVAKTLEDCVTSIRVYGPFKRCLAANEDAKSYCEVLNEAYPIIVLTIESDEAAVEPTPEQVPDVEITHECWFTKPVQISSSELKWLATDAITFEDIPHTNDQTWYFGKCTGIKFLESTKGYDHPWLNGRGHIMKSSQMDAEYEPYPELEYALTDKPMYTVKIRDNLRLTVPDEIAKKYKAGRIINIVTSDVKHDFGGDTGWSGVIDERNQIAIPEHIATTYGIRDGSIITIWEGSPIQLRMSAGLAWKDTTDQPGNVISEVKVDSMEIRLCKNTSAGFVHYTVELLDQPRTQYGTQWRNLVHCHESIAPEPSLMALQHRAAETLYRMFAVEELTLQQRQKANEHIGSVLKNLML